MKSGFAAIVGRPSTGKSTLLNALCGEKVAITSPSPQTTRNAIRGIINVPEGQVVFLDTPGYHQSEKKFNSYLRRVVHRTLDEADIILYVIDGTRMPGQEEFSIMKILSRAKAPIIAAVNKIDASPKYLSEICGLIRINIDPVAIINISALKAAHLDVLTAAIIDLCPEGDILYPADIITDQDTEFRIAEIIREQAISRCRQELPHSLYVEIADMEFTQSSTKTMWIRAFIMVENQSQIGMLVGQKGNQIKNIRLASLKEMRKIFPWRIQLDLRVKGHPKWHSKDSLLIDLTK